jgi:hypothetical protein
MCRSIILSLHIFFFGGGGEWNNLVSHIRGRSQTDGGVEQGAEENILA